MGVLGSRRWFAHEVSVSCHLPPPGVGVVNGEDHLSCFLGGVGVVNWLLIASNPSSFLNCDSVAPWGTRNKFCAVIQVPAAHHNVPCNGSSSLIKQVVIAKQNRVREISFYFFQHKTKKKKKITVTLKDGRVGRM